MHYRHRVFQLNSKEFEKGHHLGRSHFGEKPFWREKNVYALNIKKKKNIYSIKMVLLVGQCVRVRDWWEANTRTFAKPHVALVLAVEVTRV